MSINEVLSRINQIKNRIERLQTDVFPSSAERPLSRNSAGFAEIFRKVMDGGRNLDEAPSGSGASGVNMSGPAGDVPEKERMDGAKKDFAPKNNQVREMPPHKVIQLFAGVRNTHADKTGAAYIPARLDRIFETAGRRYNVDPLLAKAIGIIESGLNPRAVSSKGARGIMQLMPDTAAEMGVRDTVDEEDNIEGGIKYLRYLLDMFQDKLELALAAYNAGPRTVKEYGGVPPYMETQNYIRRVLEKYRELKGESV